MLTERQLLGLDEDHIRDHGEGVFLHPHCYEALRELQAAAALEGFDLKVASGFRSFERQRLIWNAKAAGERPIHDDAGVTLDADALSNQQLVEAILRYSALPGGSRHHWGSDLDVYDAAAVGVDYRVQLTPEEVAETGPFGPFHAWLDARIAQQDACGFYRPYDLDRGGVAPERWHLSYAPLAGLCAGAFNIDMLRGALEQVELQLAGEVLATLPAIYQRYIRLE